jgi:hypothetical protein
MLKVLTYLFVFVAFTITLSVIVVWLQLDNVWLFFAIKSSFALTYVVCEVAGSYLNSTSECSERP